jgi:hypothetical protein
MPFTSPFTIYGLPDLNRVFFLLEKMRGGGRSLPRRRYETGTVCFCKKMIEIIEIKSG